MASSYIASAIPWATPPWTMPWTIIGLTMFPQSSTATYLTILARPVSVSTSTTQTCAPDGKVLFTGSNRALSSSPGSTPSGRLWARKAEKATSEMVLALSGAPLTRSAPSANSMSSSATSSSCAAIFLALAMIAFDDGHAVANAGLLLPAALAQRLASSSWLTS
jgi:hypothetical protein